MGLVSLLFFSRSRLRLPEQAREIDAIVAVARARNRALGVTGVLVFTHHHFAQVLEGTPAAVDELIASMQRDTRHENMRVVDVRPTETRQFRSWSLAYSGPSLYVDRHIRPLIEAEPNIQACERLRVLLAELARTH